MRFGAPLTTLILVALGTSAPCLDPTTRAARIGLLIPAFSQAPPPPFITAFLLYGAKPADLRVEQPSGVGLVVSLRAAQTLGLSIPGLILVRADEVHRARVPRERRFDGQRRR